MESSFSLRDNPAEQEAARVSAAKLEADDESPVDEGKLLRDITFA